MKLVVLMVLNLVLFGSCTLPANSTAESSIGREEGEAEGFDVGKLRENLEIMRRLLLEDLESIPGPFLDLAEREVLSAVQVDRGVTEVIQSRSRPAGLGSAFYVPGMGAFFKLSAGAPVVRVAQKKAAQDESADSRWEAERKALRTGRSDSVAQFLSRGSRIQTQPHSYRIDPNAVQGIRDRLLETLARHGSRIEQLEERDSLTVIVTITGALRWPKVGGTPTSKREDALFTVWSASKVPPLEMILRITREDAEDYDDGKIDVEELLDVARIDYL